MNYEKFYAEDHSEKDYYVSSYSGTVSSSGSVNLSPDYSSVTYNWQTIEKKDSAYEENYYIKPIERGKKDTVLQLEKKFFDKGGDLYSRVKNNERLHEGYMSIDPKSCFGWIIRSRRLVSFACLFVFLLLFAYLVSVMQGMGGIVTVLSNSSDIGSELYEYYFSTKFPIIALVAGIIVTILLLIFYQSRKEYVFDLESKMCTIFIVLFVFIIIFGIYFGIGFLSSSVLPLFMINLLGVVVSIVFVVKCINKNDKNNYTRMWKLLNDSKRMEDLEKLAAEINSYTKIEAYKSLEGESIMEDNGRDHSKSFYFIK